MGLIAACARALSCAHGKAGVGLLPNPSGAYARPMPLKVRPGHPPPSATRFHASTGHKIKSMPGAMRTARLLLATQAWIYGKLPSGLPPPAVAFLTADERLWGARGGRG